MEEDAVIASNDVRDSVAVVGHGTEAAAGADAFRMLLQVQFARLPCDKHPVMRPCVCTGVTYAEPLISKTLPSGSRVKMGALGKGHQVHVSRYKILLFNWEGIII